MLFCLGLVYFVARGPYRALGPLNSYDFAAVYGASRCWLHGHNPYDMREVRKALAAAGDRPPMPYSDPPPSVYLPTALPFVATVAFLSWIRARMIWCVLSVLAFVCPLLIMFKDVMFKNASLSGDAKWILGAAVLLFSPVTSGLSTGNPSVLACGLVILAVNLAMLERPIGSALALGVAHSLKPQLTICAVLLFALWGCWRPLLLSFLVPVISGAVSILRAGSVGEYIRWLVSLREGVAGTLAAGALNDPRPSNIFSYHMLNAQALSALFVSDLQFADVIVWTIAVTLTAIYLAMRGRVTDHRRWRDAAFFSAVTLTVVYHRYYDAQLLLLAVPFVLHSLYREHCAGERSGGIAVLCCLLVLEFPLQAIMAGWSSILRADRSPAGFLLFRHQPLTVLVMCLSLIPWSKIAANKGRSTENCYPAIQ